MEKSPSTRVLGYYRRSTFQQIVHNNFMVTPNGLVLCVLDLRSGPNQRPQPRCTLKWSSQQFHPLFCCQHYREEIERFVLYPSK